MNNQAKILIIDIETAPSTVYSWGLYDQNIAINQVVQQGYVLSWAAKWLNKKEVMSDALINYRKQFRKDPTSDKEIAKTIWTLVDEADIVIAHNGDNFDLKWLNTIFLKHEMKPVSSYKSIDTLKESKANFKFLSNKLDYVTRSLAIGEKIKHEGFSLWTKCMKGDKRAWKKMLAYNKKDVKILEDFYLEIRPYMRHHPNLGLYMDEAIRVCPACGSSRIKKKGFMYTTVNKFQRYICNDCGKNARSKSTVLNGSKRNNITK